jgi:methionyl aminopeptidase
VTVGEVTTEAERLVEATREALRHAIGEVRVGARVSDISRAVQSYAESHGYAVVRDFVGHGIGTQLHEEPQVPNFVDRGRSNPRLKPGMVLAIEPMVNLGTWKVTVADDGWTASTADGSLSAHFERSVAVTEAGPWVLGEAGSGVAL